MPESWAVPCEYRAVAMNHTVPGTDSITVYNHVLLHHFPEYCHPYEPFKCPVDGNCISIQYLCDGAPDCIDGYDEDSKLCTAGKIYPFLIIIIHIKRAMADPRREVKEAQKT